MHAALDAEIATCTRVLDQAAVEKAIAEERCARSCSRSTGMAREIALISLP